MEHVTCALCNGSGAEPLFAKWGLQIVRCTSCGLAYVNPRTLSVEDDSYFQGPYLETIERDGALQPGIEYVYRRIADHLETSLTPARLLDVGCAMGHFMEFAKGRGWSVHGVECSAFAAAYGRERWALPIQTASDLRDTRLPGSFFDACVLIEVIELLPHPMETLREVHRLLKPGGVLYVTTPNFASYLALAQRENWSAVVPTGHLYYFTAETLSALTRGAGFDGNVDLTEAAGFALEMERIPSSERPREEELHRLRERCEREDSGKISNGRAEGLAICATKPFSGAEALYASRRCVEPLSRLEGRLACGSSGSVEDRKVYLIRDGKKHWVTSVGWLEKRGMTLSETVQVDSRLLATIIAGPPLG